MIVGFSIYWLRDRVNKTEGESKEDKKRRIKKFKLPHKNEKHEVFMNEEKHESTDELHEKHYAHVK